MTPAGFDTPANSPRKQGLPPYALQYALQYRLESQRTRRSLPIPSPDWRRPGTVWPLPIGSP